MTGKIFFIDGHALIFKMYYAFLRRPMINSKGADMSILYGFTKYILELLGREKPDYLAVAFDPPGVIVSWFQNFSLRQNVNLLIIGMWNATF